MNLPLPSAGCLLGAVLNTDHVVFSVCLVFVQHDAAQLFLTLWNLIKRQMKKPELVRTVTEKNTRSFGPCYVLSNGRGNLDFIGFNIMNHS